MMERILELNAGEPAAAAVALRRPAGDVRCVVVFADCGALNDSNVGEFSILVSEAAHSEIPVVLALSGAGTISAKTIASFHLCFASELVVILDEGSELTAPEAVSSGILNGACGSGLEKERARETALAIARLAPAAVRSCVAAVRKGLRDELQSGLTRELELFAALFETSDMREGTQAFLEKRAPLFRGE